MKQHVYVVIPTAVYDHGIVGVYTDEAQARLVAKEIWHKTDGHHAFRIEQIEVNRTYENVFDHFPWHDQPTFIDKDPLVQVWIKEDEEAPDVETLTP